VKSSKTRLFIFLAIAWLLSVSVQGLIVPILARLELVDYRLFGINVSTLGTLILGALLFFMLSTHSKAVEFTDDVIYELKKVTWPDKDDTVSNTVVVIGVTLFIAAALGIYDYVWAEVTQLVLFTKS